ncbi:MAG: YkgJ family cysteine cluster protein [Actinomycetota bacterium]
MDYFDEEPGEEPEASDLQRLMADLKKKGWGKGRLDNMERRWDRTLGWGAWDAAEQERRAAQSPQQGNEWDSGWSPVEWDGARFRIDPPDPAPDAIINCAERVHLCKAVCCKLNFALTPGEVKDRKVKWDEEFPYLIAHGANGYCAHLNPEKGCEIFEDRPALCRRFDCRTDGRVWKDFEAMVPDAEWIESIVTNHQRVVLRSPLPVVQVTSQSADPPSE